MANSAVAPTSQTGPSSTSSIPPPTPSAPSSSTTSAATAASPSTPSSIVNGVTSVPPATRTRWEQVRRIIASNITAFVLTLLGLVAGVVFFVLGYLPAEAGLILTSKSYKVSMWKDCRDRPDMRETEVCKPYLDMSLGSIAKRGLSITISSVGSALRRSTSASEATGLHGPEDMSYMFLKFVAILLAVNSPWTAQFFSAPPQLLRWNYRLVAFCANTTILFGLECLLVQRFSNQAVTTSMKISSFVIGSNIISTIVEYGYADFTNYAKLHQSQHYIRFVPIALARAFVGSGAIVGSILWIVPYHRLPQASKIIPTVQTLLTWVILVTFGTLVLLAWVFVLILTKKIRIDKEAAFDEPDEESGMLSTIEQVPATIYNFVREVCLGIYRVVRGRAIGKKYPPSIYREKTD